MVRIVQVTGSLLKSGIEFSPGLEQPTHSRLSDCCIRKLVTRRLGASVLTQNTFLFVGVREMNSRLGTRPYDLQTFN